MTTSRGSTFALRPARRGLRHCRPIISVNRCHLKGQFRGQFLYAIGNDRNDDMFPIAYAVVEAETRDSWTWFMRLLLDDIGSV